MLRAGGHHARLTHAQRQAEEDHSRMLSLQRATLSGRDDPAAKVGPVMPQQSVSSASMLQRHLDKRSARSAAERAGTKSERCGEDLLPARASLEPASLEISNALYDRAVAILENHVRSLPPPRRRAT
eukprot:RCo011325